MFLWTVKKVSYFGFCLFAFVVFNAVSPTWPPVSSESFYFD